MLYILQWTWSFIFQALQIEQPMLSKYIELYQLVHSLFLELSKDRFSNSSNSWKNEVMLWYIHIPFYFAPKQLNVVGISNLLNYIGWDIGFYQHWMVNILEMHIFDHFIWGNFWKKRWTKHINKWKF